MTSYGVDSLITYRRLVGECYVTWPDESGLPENQAAAIKQTVITAEKTMGMVKANLQLKAVTATKQMASAHAMLLTRARVSAGRLLSCHANTAANARNAEKKNPNALKKSQ